MRKLRIVFMGTPDFAVESLKSILDAGFEVAGVVTSPDKPAGRGRKLQESAVKKFAVEKGLQVLQPVNLKSEVFLEDLKKLGANVQVVVAFRMLPEVVWKMPLYGTFNLHASLLPQYRGAAPINWAIINAEKETGVSTFFIDEKIDTGEMIFQEKVEISETESAGDLHDKLMLKGAALVVKTLQALEKADLNTLSQKNAANLKDAPKLDRENTRIDWKLPLETVYNLIRGLSPYPAAWTVLQNGNDEMNIKVYSSAKEYAAHDFLPGKVVQEEKQVKVAVPEGFIILEEIQLPGKRKMKVKELLNGYKFFPNSKVL